VTFDRTVTERSVEPWFAPLAELPPGVVRAIDGAALLVLPGEYEAVVYDLGPLVGLDAHVAVGEHLRLVPSVRMHTTEGVWTVRYAAGVGWVF
jgi:hypothetical protein